MASHNEGTGWDNQAELMAKRDYDIAAPPWVRREDEAGLVLAGGDDSNDQAGARSGHLVWSMPADGWVEDLPTWRAFTGQSRQDVHGWGWMAAVHPQDRDHATQVWQQALATHMPFAAAYRIRRHDGVYREFSVHGMPVTNTHGRLCRWTGSAVDITARQPHARKREEHPAYEWTAHPAEERPPPPGGERAERAAALIAEAADHKSHRPQAHTDTAVSSLRLEDLLPALLDRVHDVMCADNAAILLLDAGGQTLTVRAARGLEEEVAAHIRVPLGQGFAGRIAATRQPLVVDDLFSHPVANQFLHQRVRSAVGVPLVVEGRVLGVVHVGTARPRHFTPADVLLLQQVAERIVLAIEFTRLYEAEQQARHEAEAALSRAQVSERRFQRLVEANVIGLAIVEGVTLIEANDAFLHLIGYTRADLISGRLSWPTLTPPEHLAISNRAVQEALATGGCTPFEKEYIRKDGSRVPVLLGSVLLERDPPRFVTFVLDLTERKQLEQEREAARANELVALEVERNLDQFFNIAAHDIRTPVTTGLGYMELALRRFERLVWAPDEQQADMAASVLANLETAKRSMDRLARLTARLFDVARARSGTLEVTPERCDLTAFLREQVAGHRVAASSRTIQLALPDSQPVPVLADADRIGQVLANYVTNALKYSTDDRPIAVRLEVEHRVARVSVRDQGPGLPPEECARVWAPFHSAPGVEVRGSAIGTSGGLGLGLSICKTIVERHGGRVGVESTVGQGSTFWFTLPLAEPDDATQPTGEATRPSSQPTASA